MADELAKVRPVVLLVDDDVAASESLLRALSAQGLGGTWHVASAADEAIRAAARTSPHVAVVDLSLDKASGVEGGFRVVEALASSRAACRVLVLTGHGDAAHGVRALGLGAASFLVKPADPLHLAALVRDGVRQSCLARTVRESTDPGGDEIARTLVGASPAMKETIERLSYAASSPQPLLLTGETGTGKGASALAVHRADRSRTGRFVRFQPTFAAPDLTNSELFGHVKGAFTGAGEERRGLVAEAEGGTLFLDEIDELPRETQIALLGVLQDGTYRPVGSSAERRASFRLVCATNRDVDACVAEGKLRRDLFHRIAHLRVRLPPLRDRPGDVALLTEAVLDRLSARESLSVSYPDPKLAAWLAGRPWPGNVRQLEAAVEAAARKARWAGRGHLTAGDFSESLSGDESHAGNPSPPDGAPGGGTFAVRVEEFKAALLRDALARHGGNLTRAAKELGLDRTSMRRMLSRGSE